MPLSKLKRLKLKEAIRRRKERAKPNLLRKRGKRVTTKLS